ncbi:MAG: hypothetical protein U1E83_08215 [Methylotetracoccus sp.]
MGNSLNDSGAREHPFTAVAGEGAVPPGAKRWLGPWTAPLLVLPSLAWVLSGRTVFWWDQAWYADATVSLWSVLAERPGSWPAANLDAFEIKAPGIGWLGQFFVPLGQLGGDIDIALLVFVVLTMALVLMLVHRLAAFGGASSPAAWAGTLSIAASPLFVSLSTQYLVEGLQTLAIAYVFWIAVASTRWSAARTGGHLALASALALAAKASSPMYCAIPWSVAAFHGIRALRRRPVDDSVKAGGWTILGIGSLALAATGAWYAHHLAQLATFVRLAASGDAAQYYGTAQPFLDKLGVWVTALGREFAVPEALGACAIIIALSILWPCLRHRGTRDRLRPPRIDARRLLLCGAAFQILLVLAIFSLNVNEDPRYLLPLAAPLAMLVAASAAMLTRPARLALLLVLAAEWGYVQADATALVPADARLFHYLHPQADAASKREELTRLEATSCEPESRSRWRMVGVDIAWLNLATLNYYSAKAALRRGFRCSYANLGWAERDVRNALTRVEELNPPFFIALSVPDGIPDDPFNRVALPVLETIRNDPNWTRVPFETRFDVLVMKSRAPPDRTGRADDSDR